MALFENNIAPLSPSLDERGAKKQKKTVYNQCQISTWWARQDLNPEPDGYEPSALTIELQAPT